MTPEENKAIVHRYFMEAWGQGNTALVEEVVAPDAVFHDMVRQGLPPGRAGVLESMRTFQQGFSDMTYHIYDMIAEGDLVSFRFTSEGTHTGDLQGVPPTGRRETVHGMVLVRMRDGQIVEGWMEMDLMGLLQRLRVLPKGGMPRPVMKAMFFAQRLGDRLRGRT